MIQSIVLSSELPVTLRGAREFLQIGSGDPDDTDATIMMCLASATDYCEQYMQRALIPRTVVEAFDCWPSEGHFVRWNPLISITHIKYYDENNVLQTLNTSKYMYYTDTDIACIMLNYLETFPTVYSRPDAIRITYSAGYDPNGVIPGSLYSALLLELRHAYDFRTNEKIDSSPNRVASERIMNQYIIYRYKT